MADTKSARGKGTSRPAPARAGRSRAADPMREEEEAELRAASAEYSSALDMADRAVKDLARSAAAIARVRRRLRTGTSARYRLAVRSRASESFRTVSDVAVGLARMIAYARQDLPSPDGPPGDGRAGALGKIEQAAVLLGEAADLLSDPGPDRPRDPSLWLDRLLRAVSSASSLLSRDLRRWRSVASASFSAAEEEASGQAPFE